MMHPDHVELLQRVLMAGALCVALEFALKILKYFLIHHIYVAPV